jgi:hypothetical protein
MLESHDLAACMLVVMGRDPGFRPRAQREGGITKQLNQRMDWNNHWSW